MRRLIPCAILLALVSSAPAVASASSVVLLPRSGGSGVGPEARDAALEMARMVLSNEGWTVFAIDDEEVSVALPAHLSSCGPEDHCAAELRSFLSTDAAVGLRLWGSEDRIERVGAVIVGLRGVGYRAIAEVTEEQPIEFAVAAAVRGAARAWREGQGGFEPPAPDVQVDTEFDDRLEPSPLNWALGTVVLLGSAPMLGFGINTAVRDGDCTATGLGGACVERVRFREGAGIFTGIGAAVLIAGIVVLIAQPIRMHVSADRESAQLTVEGSF